MKKKILLFFMLLAAFFFLTATPNNVSKELEELEIIDVPEVEAASISSGGRAVYLKPNSNWTQSNAWFAVHYFNNSTGTKGWAKMTAVPGNSGYYSVIIPDGEWPNIIFCRMNSANTSELDWSNMWDQTQDLTYSDDKNCFTVGSGQWNNASGTWSYFSNDKKIDYLFLKPTNLWDNTGAWFAARFFNDVNNEEKWIKMDEINDSGTYSVPVPEGYYKVILCRMNPASESLSWDNRWNQTVDLSLQTDGKNLFTITSNNGNSCNGNWSTYSHTGPDKLYLVINDEWNKANARFAAFFFGNKDVWVDMKPVDNLGRVYQVDVPDKKYPFVIISRMNPNTVVNTWDNRWGQTVDLVIPSDNNCLTIDVDATENDRNVTGSWSTATPDTKTIYFATNQKWENAYVNVKLNNNTNELWYNTQMTATGDIYRNDIDVKAGYNKIYSITIPTLYSGVEEMQFDFDTSDGFTGSHPAVTSWMNSSEYDGKLYYYGVNNGTIDDSSLIGWKSNNTKVNFYAADKTTQLGSSVTGRWMHDKIDAPADLVPNDYANWTALYGWYRKSNFTLSDKCYNYKKVVVYHEDGKNYGSYYAAIANTKRFYFATNNANLAETIYANTNVSKTGDIWLNLQMKLLNNSEISNYDSSDQVNYYNEYKMYYVDMPLPEEGISELEFHNGQWQNKHALVISGNWITKSNLNEDLYYLEVDASGKATANTGWKNKITTAFYVNYAGGKDVLIIAHEGNKITPPELDNPDDSFVFAGWYDNAELMNSSVTTFVVSSTKNGYWASWCIPFQRNYDIHLILNSDSPWITKMGSEGNVVMFLYGVSPEHYQLPIKVTLNSDGSRVYTFRLPNDRDYSNCIFLCSDNGSIGTDVWEHRIYQTHDLKRTADDSGRIYYGYEITDLYEAKEYNGDWVHMSGGVSFKNYDGLNNSYSIFHKEGYEVRIPISAPKNQYFSHWDNEVGNKVNLTFPYTLIGEKVTYTATWADTAHFIDSDFFVKYKETSRKENTYGVIPFYTGIRFMAADSLVDFNNFEDIIYRATITINGETKITEYDHYADFVAVVENLCSEYECYVPILNGYVNTASAEWSKIKRTFAIKLEAIGKTSNNIYFNCTEDEINVNGTYKPISISNYVDKYIAEQRHSYIFDLEHDYEDRALYQMHVHTFETSENINEKYINDALYLYKHCQICDLKEKIDGVLMQYTVDENTGQYIYKATQNNSGIAEINSYVGTYPDKITYIYESGEYNYSNDERTYAYAAFDCDGRLLNEFKSLYDAIEACYDYDMTCIANNIDPYDDNEMGSYVCKVTRDGYDEVKMFVNKETYIVTSDGQNSDMFWYYEDGTSLRKYGSWNKNYWDELLKNSKYISIERGAKTEQRDSLIKGYASSYELFAINSKYSSISKPSTASEVYEHCFGLESAVNINLIHGAGITGARIRLALKDARIYPSYADSDNAWIYVGYIVYDSLQVLHIGLKCDTRTGNWYRYVGEVTIDESGIEIIKEMTGASGKNDVCYMTSTWIPAGTIVNGVAVEEGYYQPNENVSIGLNVGKPSYSNGVRTKIHTIKYTFDDDFNGSFEEDDTNKLYNDRTFVESVVSEITLTDAQINSTYDYINEVSSIRFTIGMDIETKDDLADFMCGAKFENVVINYSHAYVAKTTSNYGVTYEHGSNVDVHNLYDMSTGNFVLNDCNYNSTIYNNLVATYSFDDKYKSGNYHIPVYNFSFRNIDSTNPSLSTAITDVTNEIHKIEAIETIVEHDYYDYLNKETSYAEYSDLVLNAESVFNALPNDEKTALELTYRDSNSYTARINRVKSFINNTELFGYYAYGNIYSVSQDGYLKNDIHYLTSDVEGKYNSGNILEVIGGRMSYNTHENTYILEISLPLYGRVSFNYNNKVLTTENPTNDQVEISKITGYYKKGDADWTQNLYVHNVPTDFICSSARGGSYRIIYNPTTNVLHIDEPAKGGSNFVGPYRYVADGSKEIIRAYNRFTYRYFDNDTDTLYDPIVAEYDAQNGVYSVTVGVDTYDGIKFYYDGKIIKPTTGTKVNGLYGLHKNFAKEMYIYNSPIDPTTDGKSDIFMTPYKEKNSNGNYVATTYYYTFIYSPMTDTLYITPSLGTYDIPYVEDYSKGLSYWKEGTILHTRDNDWNTILYPNGKIATDSANGWKAYYVFDAEGKIAYSVCYPVSGYGGYDQTTYYAHPEYNDYNKNPAIYVHKVTDDNGVARVTGWDLLAPTGGFALTAHQHETPAPYLNDLSNLLSMGEMTTMEPAKWNARSTLDKNIRVKIVQIASNEYRLVVYYSYNGNVINVLK